jgi:hypothetical protein
VSSIDQRALNFYFEHLGFERVGSRTEEPGFELFMITVQPQLLLTKIGKIDENKERIPSRQG